MDYILLNNYQFVNIIIQRSEELKSGAIPLVEYNEDEYNRCEDIAEKEFFERKLDDKFITINGKKVYLKQCKFINGCSKK